MLSYEITEVLNASGNDLVVHWEFTPTTDDLSVVKTTIFRSYDEPDAGDEVELGSVTGEFLFRDVIVNRQNRRRNAFYRIVSEGPSNTVEKRGIFIEREPDGIVRAVLRRTRVDIRCAGVPVFFFKKRTTGTRCDCYDEDLGLVDTGCDDCAGTGFIGGFYRPLLTMLKMGVPAQQSNPEDIRRQPETTEGFYVSAPRISPGDLFFELERGLRWRVGTPVQPHEFHRTITLQELILEEVNPADVEYDVFKLPKDPGTPLIQPRQRRSIRYIAEDGTAATIELVEVSAKNEPVS